VPTATEHLDWAARCEAVSAALESTHPEWAITALFYAALHYVDALFATQQTKRRLPQDYENHSARNTAVRERIRRHWRNYQALYEDSLSARYECHHFTVDDVRISRAEDLEPIKQYVLTRVRRLAAPPTPYSLSAK
jgi:hypothetical protein